MMKKPAIILIFLSISFSSDFSFADYIVTGQIDGNVCKFGIVCSHQRLDAVKKDGEFYTINKRYSSVDEYKNGRCWIYTKSNFFINLFKQGFYQEQSDGSYKKLKPDYVTFLCRKE